MADDNQTPTDGDNSSQTSPTPPTPQKTQSLSDQEQMKRVTSLTSSIEENKLTSTISNNRLKSKLGEAREEPVEEKKRPGIISRKQPPPQDTVIQDKRAYVPPTPRDYTTALRIFQTHAVELRFKRRSGYPSTRPPGHAKETRRMICTANWKFVSHVLTKKIFGWNNPKSNRGISWYKSRNLIIIWDFMKNDFRMVSLDDWDILAATPLAKMWDKLAFVAFYKGYLGRLKPNDRNKFYDG